jgi:hypothetical protein
MGDEVTLEIRPIRPGASDIDEMLTLCAHCRDLAEEWIASGECVWLSTAMKC